MTEVPAGNVTYLFTDVEGSTVLWERQSELMNDALAKHDRLLLAAFANHRGYVFSTAGDSFGVAFESADDAIAAAVFVQRELQAADGPLKLKIRMGLHTGKATIRDGNYFGVEVNRAARVMSVAHGGQVLFSQATRERLDADTPNLDLGEHLLKDLARPERIFQLIHSDLGGSFPALVTVDGRPSAFPKPLTRFVGREAELTELAQLLTQHRLVTLTGSGGAGKTRLALQAATDARYQFPDGLRVAELAGVVDPDVLVDEVAQVFGVQAAADTPLIETLTAVVGSRRELLVLDNCEQLVDAASNLVAQLLRACPNIKVLATSRELLSVRGEFVYRVPALATPSADTAASALLDYDAVSLFVDRAALANRNFKLTPDARSDIITICNRLDGIPLALELAAARTRVMSVAQVAQRLDHRFLSVGVETGVDSRHQTMQNAIDWSYDLLSEQEQILFRRLGVFTGHCLLESVEAVCAGAPLAEADIADLLFGLVDKSMVTLNNGVVSTTRYELLQSMRIYGLKQLDANGELEDLLGWHLDHYTAYAEELQTMRRDGDLRSALAKLDENEDNIRAALRFGLQDERHEQAAAMVSSLGYLWYAGGLYREGSDWCAELFDAQPDLSNEVWAGVLHAYGTLLGSWSQPQVGTEILQQEVDLRRELADPARLAAALNNLGNLYHDVGRFDEGQAMLVEAIEQFRLAGESPTLALSSLGAGYLHTGVLEPATTHYTLALEEAAAAQDEYAVALATGGLGQCASLRGEFAHGRSLLQEARDRFESLMVAPGVASADFHMARIDRAEGHHQQAAARLLASLSAPEAHWYLATQYWILQTAAAIITDDELAANLLGVASAHYDRSPELQPDFVLSDLVATTDELRARVGGSVLAPWLAKGRRLATSKALSEAIGALQTLTSDDPTNSDARV